MDGMSVIEETVRSMKCHFCKQSLSFSPIFINCQDGGKNRCGRCKTIKNGEWVRNVVFEGVAQCLMYPCIYCGEIVPWALVEQHESSCEHKTIQCPFKYSGCTEDIEIEEMGGHVTHNHPRKIFHDKVFYEINLNKQTTPLLLIVEETQFIIYILRDSIFVGCLGRIEKFSSFNVEFTSENGDRCVTYKNKMIVEFNERMHCYECIKDRCDCEYHPYSRKYVKPAVHPDTNPFNLFSMMELLNTPALVRVSITVVSNEVESDNPQTELSFDAFSSLIRRHLECPVCMEYFVGPIFSCKKGHGICRKCKLKINRCPTCESEFEGSRCYQLENMAENIHISCPNKTRGCSFVGNLERIGDHENGCGYKGPTERVVPGGRKGSSRCQAGSGDTFDKTFNRPYRKMLSNFNIE